MIYSTPMFLIERDDQQELVRFEATMHVRTGRSTKTERGPRRVDIEMLKWEAVGTSKLLGGEVRYQLLKGMKSYVTGLTPAADLPGRMQLSGQFAFYLNGQKVDEHRGGASGLVSGIPPAEGDLFHISGKEVSVGNVKISGVACACPALGFAREE